MPLPSSARGLCATSTRHPLRLPKGVEQGCARCRVCGRAKSRTFAQTVYSYSASNQKRNGHANCSDFQFRRENTTTSIYPKDREHANDEKPHSSKLTNTSRESRIYVEICRTLNRIDKKPEKNAEGESRQILGFHEPACPNDYEQSHKCWNRRGA